MSILIDIIWYQYGGFLKYGYPELSSNLDWDFPNKNHPAIGGSPILGNPHISNSATWLPLWWSVPYPLPRWKTPRWPFRPWRPDFEKPSEPGVTGSPSLWTKMVLISWYQSQMLHVWNIYPHDWAIFGVNVGKYSMHGASGVDKLIPMQFFIVFSQWFIIYKDL